MMKEFAKKLIGRLEESEERYDDVSFAQLNEFGRTLDYEYAKGKRDGVAESKEIVNQLAEEYNESETGFISRTKVLQFIEDIEYNKDIPKNYGTLLDIMRYIRKMPAISNNNDWIPCSERLPEEGGSYLVIGKTGGATVTRWYPPSQFYPNGHFGGNSSDYIRYWMPRPKAPIQEEEGRI